MNISLKMDNHDNDNHPSRIINTVANPWGHRFGFSDWRGGVQHEWRTNLGGNLNAFQITTILRSNPVRLLLLCHGGGGSHHGLLPVTAGLPHGQHRALYSRG